MELGVQYQYYFSATILSLNLDAHTCEKLNERVLEPNQVHLLRAKFTADH